MVSLDAILVCRKTGEDLNSHIDIMASKIKAQKLEELFKSGGIQLSKSDKFVIWASQLIVEMSNRSMSFEDMNCLLQQQSMMPNKPVAAAERI
jgi:hypothetical protein